VVTCTRLHSPSSALAKQFTMGFAMHMYTPIIIIIIYINGSKFFEFSGRELRVPGGACSGMIHYEDAFSCPIERQKRHYN